jgi:[lysine-biosynthesis-protein LysW]--L-2-aminoadipate ligase
VILDRSLDFDLLEGAQQPSPSGKAWSDYDLVLERAVSTSRGLYTLMLLNEWGVPTLNSYQTAHICGDKLTTTLMLAQANVPTTQRTVAFTPESALASLETLGYPAVLETGTAGFVGAVAGAGERCRNGRKRH